MASVTEVPGLSDEERRAYYEMMREDAASEAAGAGIVFAQGENPYSGDWEMKLDDWPEHPPETLDSEIASATLVVAQPYKKNGRVRASTLKRVQVNGAEVQAMREAVGWGKLKENFSNFDAFAYGNSAALSGSNSLMGQYVPLWPGPVTRQLYWQDYWQMSAKAFEAYNHDPISWRCIHMKEEFALGRGLQCKVTYSRGSNKQGQRHDKGSDVWEEFWKRNKFGNRLSTIARDYCWGGEQFLRYFKTGQKLTVRSLDPASIYDLITDPEDIETVFAYHQQFQTAYQLYPPTQSKPTGESSAPTGPSDPGAVTKYIIRQILPQEIDHYKANSSAYERRGRSDLYPALGWIKRLRDYLTAHVVQADMLARICWDLEVAGNQGAIQSLRQQLFPGGRPPAPGTVFGHNSASKLSAVAPVRSGGSSGRADPILDALVTMVSLSAGLPKDWLGFGIQSTRAGALVATEPASKSMEDLQGTLEGMTHDAFNRAMAAAGITDAQLEVTFPSIASEDRKQKLDDLGTMEANQWISKRSAAEIAASEMDITNYDYDSEQEEIAKEFDDAADTESDGTPKQGGQIRRTAIMATKRQASKIDVTKSMSVDFEPPGQAAPEDGSGTVLPAPGSQDGTGRTVAGGGSHPADPNPMSADGKKDIKNDHAKLRNAGAIEVPAEEYWRMVRETAQGSRRRSDDPGYRQDADQYLHQSAEILGQLAGSVVEATQSGLRMLEAERRSMQEERREHRGLLRRILGRAGESGTDPEGGKPDEA